MYKQCIQIYSIQEYIAVEKMFSLINENCEEILRYQNGIIETNKNTYRAQKYSINLRGNRYQKVYIDSRIEQELQEEILVKLVPPLNVIINHEYEKWDYKSNIFYF